MDYVVDLVENMQVECYTPSFSHSQCVSVFDVIDVSSGRVLDW